jgi:hypothetical protein
MRLKTLFTVSACAFALQLRAQETNSIVQLQQRLDAMQANFERTIAVQRAEIDSLKQEVAAIHAAPPRPLLAETSATGSAPPPLVIESKPWSPGDSIRVGKGGTYADLSLVGTFAVGGSTASDINSLQLGGHDPHQRGFTVQGAELALQGAVDPYFRGAANIAFLIGNSSETSVELEEAWLETVSLPHNLQIRAGQYLTDFGRVNTQHPHAWGFVDAPIVNARLLGEDGLRNPGARLSWLVPTPFYSELFLGVQNSQGGTAHSFRDDHGGDAFFGRVNTSRSVKKFSDMLYSARYAASFEPTDNQTLLGGLSAVFGPNSSGGDTDTQIYGADVYWKWKSPRAHGGFPFVSWQTEALLRRYQAGESTTVDLNNDTVLDPVPRETVTDWGAYSQVLWGFKPGWVAALRGDFVTGKKAAYENLYGADLSRATRWRISPNLTWYPSEFSKIRLQYNYDHRDLIGVDHSIWLQFEFLLGAHAAHKF